jgi:hypothetical protein
MEPEADRKKAEQEWFDAGPIPEILVHEVNSGNPKKEEYPFHSSARSAVSFSMGSHHCLLI